MRSSEQLETLIDNLHLISTQALEAAQDEQWATLENLNLERDRLLESISVTPESANSRLQGKIGSILELDQQILALTTSVLDDTAVKIKTSALKAKVSHEYLAIQTTT